MKAGVGGGWWRKGKRDDAGKLFPSERATKFREGDCVSFSSHFSFLSEGKIVESIGGSRTAGEE